MVYLLLVRPLESKAQNNLEIFNELCLTVISYSMFCFCSFIEDPDTVNSIGYLVIAATCFNLLSNMLVILKISFPTIKTALISLFNRLKTKFKTEKAKKDI